VIKEYLKISFRQLKKQKLNMFVNILGLSIGICSAFMIFMWGRSEFSYDKFFKTENKIYYLCKKRSIGEYGSFGINYAILPQLKDRFSEIHDFTRFVNQSNFQTSYFTVDNSEESNNVISFYETKFCVADTGFFRVLPFEFIHGNAEHAFDSPNSIILRDEVAKKYFGDTNPIGKIISHNNNKDLVITGVIKIPNNSTINFDLLGSIHDFRSNKVNSWDVDGPGIFSLNKGTNAKHFQQSISGFYHEINPYGDEKTFLDVLPLSSIHLHFGAQTRIVFILSIGIFILILACLNFINLSIASGLTRFKEIMVRKVFGAEKIQIVKQFLFETFIMALISTVLSIILIELLLPFFNNLMQQSLRFFEYSNFGFNISVFSGIILFTMILSGLYPALYFADKHPIQILRGNSTHKSNKGRLRKFSLIFQYAVTIFLLICTLIYSKQILFIRSKDLGLNYEGVVKLPITKEISDNFENWRNDLEMFPKVLHVSAASTIPTSIDNSSDMSWVNDQNKNSTISFNFAMVQPDYFETFEMEMAEGRSFSKDIKSDLEGYIVNEFGAKLIAPNGSAIGKNINFWGVDGVVMGVVKNFHDRPLLYEIGPLILDPNPQHHFFIKYIFVKIAPGNYDSTIDNIRNIYNRYSPNAPFEYQFLDSIKMDEYQSIKIISKITGIAALLTILIASFGLFGLAALNIRKKIKEIGVRKVLGATVNNILFNLNKEVIQLILIANLFAWPLSWLFMNKMLQNFAYQTPINFSLFIMVGFLSLIIALTTISFHALKAANSNPVKSLKYE